MRLLKSGHSIREYTYWNNLRAYLGFLVTAFSQPSNLFIVLQALALHAPPWLISLAKYIPVKRLSVLKNAKTKSLAFARKLIQNTRSKPQGLVDLHILGVLGRQMMLNRFRTSSRLLIGILKHELPNLRPLGSSRKWKR